MLAQIEVRLISPCVFKLSNAVDIDSIPTVPKQGSEPLLSTLGERSPEAIDYLGVSYGITLPLLKFWCRAGYVPLYIR